MSVSTSFTHRFAQRVWARRWSRVKTVAVAASVLVVLGVIGWVVFFSTVFGVRDVNVAGTDRVSVHQVIDAADVAIGTPLSRLDTGGIAARVEELAPVRTVSVKRAWPGSVEIVVEERVAAAVKERGSGWTLVDPSGVAYADVQRRPKGLPLVSAPVDAGAPALKAALSVLNSVPPAVRRQVREVRAASADHVLLRLTKDRTVVWGDPDRRQRKGAVLAALITRKARIYDVSAPDAPTTRQ